MEESNDIFQQRGMGGLANSGSPALLTIKSTSTAAGAKAVNLDIIASHFSGVAADNYQAMKSFDDSVYITLFGQALTKYSITCTTVPNKCKDAKIALTSLGALYKAYRIGNDSRPLITISLDDMTIKGFLVEMPIETKTFNSGSNAISFSMVILGQVVLS